MQRGDHGDLWVVGGFGIFVEILGGFGHRWLASGSSFYGPSSYEGGQGDQGPGDLLNLGCLDWIEAALEMEKVHGTC